MNKKILVTLLTILLTTSATAFDLEIQQDSPVKVNYGGQGADLTIECVEGKCPGEDATGQAGIQLKVCGNTADAYSPPTPYEDISYSVDMSFKVPKDASCGIGEYQMKINGDNIGKLKVTPKGGISENKGEYLVAEIDELSGTATIELQSFFLTNDDDTPIGEEIPEPGIQLNRVKLAGAEESFASVKNGTINNNLHNVIDDCPTDSANPAGCDVAERYDLFTIGGEDLQKSDYLNAVDTATPIHGRTGGYKVQGSNTYKDDASDQYKIEQGPENIIVGEDAETTSNDRHFFICRENGKKHRVKLNGQIYYCDQTDKGHFEGEWEWQQARDLTAEIAFYNEPVDGWVGFAAQNPELFTEKWENAYGVSPKTQPVEVRAECWRGLPKQRPDQNEDILTMTTEWDGTVFTTAGKLPERSWTGFDRSEGYNRYSCNYGFQQEWSNPIGFEKYGPDYIIAGTNNYGPFKVEHVTEPSMQKDSYQAIEQYTNTGIPHNQLFQNFPGALEEKNRNPIDVWEARDWE